MQSTLSKVTLYYPQKFNRRPDSCESLDARAALPQNCSKTKLIAGSLDVNSTDVPEVAHRRAIRAWPTLPWNAASAINQSTRIENTPNFSLFLAPMLPCSKKPPARLF